MVPAPVSASPPPCAPHSPVIPLSSLQRNNFEKTVGPSASRFRTTPTPLLCPFDPPVGRGTAVSCADQRHSISAITSYGIFDSQRIVARRTFAPSNPCVIVLVVLLALPPSSLSSTPPLLRSYPTPIQKGSPPSGLPVSPLLLQYASIWGYVGVMWYRSFPGAHGQ